MTVQRRTDICLAYEKLKNLREVAEIFRISKSTVRNAIRDDWEPRAPALGRPTVFSKRDEDHILSTIKKSTIFLLQRLSGKISLNSVVQLSEK